jgi:hypothetical protein
MARKKRLRGIHCLRRAGWMGSKVSRPNAAATRRKRNDVKF